MRNNDLSNKSAPTFLFRVEDFLVEYKDKSMWDKVANFVVGKEKRAVLNEDVVSAIYKIFRLTNMTLDLVIDRKNYSRDIELLIEDLPYGRLLQIDKPVQISVKLNTGEYIYYVDNDLDKLSMVSNKRAITLDTFNTLV